MDERKFVHSTCTKCGQKLEFPEEYDGSLLTCPMCKYERHIISDEGLAKMSENEAKGAHYNLSWLSRQPQEKKLPTKWLFFWTYIRIPAGLFLSISEFRPIPDQNPNGAILGDLSLLALDALMLFL